mgnify:CR=1 FL=1
MIGGNDERQTHELVPPDGERVDDRKQFLFVRRVVDFGRNELLRVVSHGLARLSRRSLEQDTSEADRT